jgi:hypothetical protein
MSASTPVPSPDPELPEDRKSTTPQDLQRELPLTIEELGTLIDFFLLLDAWDKKGKIV